MIAVHFNEYVGKSYKDPDSGDFFVHLKNFQADYEAIVSDSESRLKAIYFLENFPQHFPTENGYFNGDLISPICREVSEHSDHQNDWRSRTIDTVLLPVKIPVIRLTKKLLSQWDAHVEKDCTHFCYPSGIFTYILDIIFTSLSIPVN